MNAHYFETIEKRFTTIFGYLTENLLHTPKYSTTDHWIQESIKQIINSGLFWAVGAAEKK